MDFFWGSFLTYVGNVLGQTAAFLLARYLFKSSVHQCISARWQHFDLIDAAMKREGATLVFVRPQTCSSSSMQKYHSKAMMSNAARGLLFICACPTALGHSNGCKLASAGLTHTKTSAKCAAVIDATRMQVLRLNPCIPYNLLNYAMGLTSIGFWTYTWSSAIAVLPFVVSFVYMGCLSTNVYELMEGGWSSNGSMLPWALVSAVILIASVVYGYWFTKRALADALEEAMTPTQGADAIDGTDQAPFAMPRDDGPFVVGTAFGSVVHDSGDGTLQHR